MAGNLDSLRIVPSLSNDLKANPGSSDQNASQGARLFELPAFFEDVTEVFNRLWISTDRAG